MFAGSYVPNNVLQAAFGADASKTILATGEAAFASAATVDLVDILLILYYPVLDLVVLQVEKFLKN